MLDLSDPKYVAYTSFITSYAHPEFTSEKTHVHHILPRCCGGTDEPINLIRLTISAHREAHKLLAELVTEQPYSKKLKYAFREFDRTYNAPVYSNRGAFSMTKQFTHKQSKPHEQDLLDLLGSMSKGARDLFLHLKSVRDYRTNIAVMGLPWNKSTLSRAYTELFKLDLVKKTKVTAPVEFNNVTINFPKNSYIINPTYIMLSERYADQAQAIWDSL